MTYHIKYKNINSIVFDLPVTLTDVKSDLPIPYLKLNPNLCVK